MSAYLKYFELEQSPFEGKAQSKVVLGTRALRDAFKAIRNGLEEGSARICVSGGPGFGKTSLARSLPKLLGDTARVALVRDPSVPWQSLRGQIAKQWGLEAHGLARNRLLEAGHERRLVLVVDRAEHASEEFLDHLDIMLSIRSESDEPAVQSVLLACLTGTGQGKPAPIVWWLDRIQTLDLEFAPIPREGVASYIHKHLKRAGWRGERLFSSEAALVIAGVTGGVPGEISRFCERLLAEAAEHRHPVIDAEFVQESIDASNGGDDSEGAHESPDANCDAIDSVDRIDHIDDAHGIDAVVGAATGDELELANPAADMASGDTRPDGIGPDDDEPSANHSSNSLAQTLERFERAEADVSALSPDSRDEQEPESDDEDADECLGDSSEEDSLAALEDYLGAPVSAEELRAIRRVSLGQQLGAIAAILLAALVGAVAFAWMGIDPEQTTARESRKSDRPPLSMLESTKPAAIDAPTPTLARIRGPVASIDTPAGASFTMEHLSITGPGSASTSFSASTSASISASTPTSTPTSASASTSTLISEAAEAVMPPDSPILPRTVRQGTAHLGDLPDSAWEEDGAGELSPDDFEDMRPASMRADAAMDFDTEAQF